MQLEKRKHSKMLMLYLVVGVERNKNQRGWLFVGFYLSHILSIHVLFSKYMEGTFLVTPTCPQFNIFKRQFLKNPNYL
jgi:hypothetical protein